VERTAGIPGWLAHLESLADSGVTRLNPVTVRMVRQHLRSPVIASVLCLLLVLGVSGVAIATTANQSVPQGIPVWHVPVLRGELLFLVVIGLWSAVAWIAQPLVFISAVRNERDESSWDLLELTGLSPLRILGGMVIAAVIQQILLLAIMAPFLVLAWLLNGLDPLAILLALVVVPLHGLVSVCLGIKATVTGKRGGFAGRPGRAAIGSSLGWLLTMYLLWLSLSLPGMIPGAPSLRAIGPGTVITIMLLSNLALHMGAAALVDAAMRLTHPAQDRSRVPRLMTLIFVANLAVVLGVLVLLGYLSWILALAWFAAVSAAWNAYSSIDGFAESYHHTPRQARACAPRPGLRRMLLDPGAAAARRFHLSIALPALVIGVITWVVGFGSLDGSGAIGAVAVGVVCYGAIILTLADALARTGDRNQAHPIRHRRWVWGFVLLGTLAGGFFGTVTKGSALLAAISPMFGLIPFGMAGSGTRENESIGAVILICCSGFFALATIIQQARHHPEIRPMRGELT
jgi:hypothetical protein